jgi:hypothetical protein
MRRFVNLAEAWSRLYDGSPLGLLATATSLGMAALVMWAGAEKLRKLDATAKVALHLGLPRRLALPAAALLALTEIGVAVGLVWCPRSYVVLGAVLGLSLLFAVAGALALRRGERIACNCFGSTGTGYLGRAQLMALPLWIGGCLLSSAAAPSARSTGEATMMLAVLTAAMALARLPAALSAFLGARSDRRSATEMYTWLR